MKIKKLITAMMSAAVILSCGITASAAEDLSTFDYKAYADAYADLKSAFGYDAAKLYNHYVTRGKAEGRIASFAGAPAAAAAPAVQSALGEFAKFDYRAYANIYPDLKAAYGYDAAKLYAHYVNYGYAQGRVGTFLAAPNPANAPVYGATPGTVLPNLTYTTATAPATLLDPRPPVALSQYYTSADAKAEAAWWKQLSEIVLMSNDKLIAEIISTREWWLESAMIDEAMSKGQIKYDPRYVWIQRELPNERISYLKGELNERLEMLEFAEDPWYQEYAYESDAYKRALQSDTRILFQYKNNYEGLPAPPADPFVPPAAQ